MEFQIPWSGKAQTAAAAICLFCHRPAWVAALDLGGQEKAVISKLPSPASVIVIKGVHSN